MGSGSERTAAWVFEALTWAVAGAGPGGTAPLRTVVAAADAIEHTVLTVDELAGALDRLVRAGLVDVSVRAVGGDGDRAEVRLASAGEALRDRCPGSVAAKRLGWFADQLARGGSATDAVPASDGGGPVDRAAVAAAIDAYVTG